MKIYEPIIKKSYTCQACNNEFNSDVDLKIEPGIMPFCSQKCKFNIIYELIKNLGYDDETLKLFEKVCGFKQKEGEFKRNTAIYHITKKYVNMDLSSVKWIGTRDRDKIGTSLECPKRTGTKVGTNPPYIGGCPLSLSLHSDNCPNVPVLMSQSKKKENLKKWI
jgi:hypothetical protein